MSMTLLPNKPAMEGGKSDLPAAITKAASKQTYYTIRLLMDRDRMQDAFRAYAYFRWVDDQLDNNRGSQQEKKTFIDHQLELLEACYRGDSPNALNIEEQMLVDLAGSDKEKDSGLQIYLRNMMAVMAFDVDRRGRVISYQELTHYTLLLARAVTEYMFYFIGHKDASPGGTNRYHAVCGAHVVHMLRDMVDDIALGYINIPGEILNTGHISLDELNSRPFRLWVCERAQLAHQYIEAGRKYISKVKSLHCRLAGFAYLARFEWMLRAIEREQYCLRAEYSERKSPKAGIWMIWRVISSLLSISSSKSDPGEPAALLDQREEK
jgi:phytoene/squalene synthetase